MGITIFTLAPQRCQQTALKGSIVANMVEELEAPKWRSHQFQDSALTPRKTKEIIRQLKYDF